MLLFVLLQRDQSQPLVSQIYGVLLEREMGA